MTQDMWDNDAMLNRLPSPYLPAIAANAQRQLALIQRHVPLTPTTRVLEVACGWGCMTVHMDKVCDVFGIDTSAKMLARNPVKRTAVMDATRLEFEDHAFELAYCRNILHHTADVDAIVREMARVARHVVFVEPNRNHLLNLLMATVMKSERKILQFTPGWFAALAQRNSLTVLDSLSYGVLISELTPRFLVWLKKWTDFRQPCGVEHMLIARATS